MATALAALVIFSAAVDRYWFPNPSSPAAASSSQVVGRAGTTQWLGSSAQSRREHAVETAAMAATIVCKEGDGGHAQRRIQGDPGLRAHSAQVASPAAPSTAPPPSEQLADILSVRPPGSQRRTCTGSVEPRDRMAILAEALKAACRQPSSY